MKNYTEFEWGVIAGMCMFAGFMFFFGALDTPMPLGIYKATLGILFGVVALLLAYYRNKGA